MRTHPVFALLFAAISFPQLLLAQDLPKFKRTMIIHGDLDRLVPLQQAKIFEERCRKENVPFKLVVKEGKDHGWKEMD